MRQALLAVLLQAMCAAQVFDDAVDPDLQKLLTRTGAAAALASHFGEKHTLALNVLKGAHTLGWTGWGRQSEYHCQHLCQRELVGGDGVKPI